MSMCKNLGHFINQGISFCDKSLDTFPKCSEQCPGYEEYDMGTVECGSTLPMSDLLHVEVDNKLLFAASEHELPENTMIYALMNSHAPVSDYIIKQSLDAIVKEHFDGKVAYTVLFTNTMEENEVYIFLESTDLEKLASANPTYTIQDIKVRRNNYDSKRTY